MSGSIHSCPASEAAGMAPFGSLFGGEGEDLFDDYDAFVPENLPEVGPFLADHRLLVSDEHAAFHRLTRDCFEERSVYDMTFGYNLARLNLDTRHPEAGFRYAEDRQRSGVLRAEFTPTTPFCPQAHTLTIGAFRAWNGCSERHEYDLVRVRAAPMHHRSEEIGAELAEIEETYLETGSVAGAAEEGGSVGRDDAGPSDDSEAGASETAFETDEPPRSGIDAPF